MRRIVPQTSIEAYRAQRANGRARSQCMRILRFIGEQGGDWSIGELAHALEMDKSAVSARVHELLTQTHELIARPKRKDNVSGIRVRPVALPPEQQEMFA